LQEFIHADISSESQAVELAPILKGLGNVGSDFNLRHIVAGDKLVMEQTCLSLSIFG
jgi:hypothetical protein